MTSTKSAEAISPLRRRMIEDMSVRKFGDKTRHDYIRHVESFAKFLGRSPDTATGEDLRRYQVHQTESGVHPPAMNGSVAADIPAETANIDAALAHRLVGIAQRVFAVALLEVGMPPRARRHDGWRVVQRCAVLGENLLDLRYPVWPAMAVSVGDDQQ
jgi:hypothetical protein